MEGEEKILQFRPRLEKDNAQIRRNREQRTIRQLPKQVASLEEVTIAVRNRYVAHVDQTRRASIDCYTLSHTIHGEILS